MLLALTLLSQITITLLITTIWLYCRYRSQKHTIQAFTQTLGQTSQESESTPTEKKNPDTTATPTSTTNKDESELLAYLTSSVKLCEEHFESSSINEDKVENEDTSEDASEVKDAITTEADPSFDKNAHAVSIRHAILSAEIQAINETLSPEKDYTQYWNHFIDQLMPLIDCFDALHEQANEKNNSEWQNKLDALNTEFEQVKQQLSDQLALKQDDAS